MFSPLFVVETWLLTKDGSQFQQRGENVSGYARRRLLAEAMTEILMDGVGDARSKGLEKPHEINRAGDKPQSGGSRNHGKGLQGLTVQPRAKKFRDLQEKRGF